MLRRTVRAAERRARRLSLKRYAERRGPARLRVAVLEPDGRETTIYGEDGEPRIFPDSGNSLADANRPSQAEAVLSGD